MLWDNLRGISPSYLGRFNAMRNVEKRRRGNQNSECGSDVRETLNDIVRF